MGKAANILMGIGALVGASTLDASASEKNKPNYPLIISPGERVEAKLPYETITVKANSKLSRTYAWGGGKCERSLDLIMRDSHWYGVEGAYNPGTVFDENWQWKDCNGIRRGVVSEGHANFADVMSFQLWFEQKYSREFGDKMKDHVVYNMKGLLVAHSKVTQRYQLNVEILQILINGNIPAALPGSSNMVEYK